MKERWQEELSSSVTTIDELGRVIPLAPEERDWAGISDGQSLKLSIPRSYLDLIDREAGPCDPIRKQCIPSSREFTVLPSETADPLAEDAYTLSPRLVRRYKSRALFLATDRCAMYCRHCFRRRFAGKQEGSASLLEITRAAEILARLPEVKELLISGGDPLTMTDRALERMLELFRSYREDLVLRIGTRIPVVLPSRITSGLSDLLSRFNDDHPVYVMTQFNHPRELTGESRAALRRLRDAGISLFNQSVLLSGINDHADVLETLFNDLVGAGVKPYYLFQGDLASGTGHFRTPLAQTFEIEAALRGRLSGLAMPMVAVDLPNGGGKVPVSRYHCVRQEEGRFQFSSSEGELFWYVDPTDAQ
jgi:lysine 2,3-aminomutase